MNTKQIIKKTALAGAILFAASSTAQAAALSSSVVEINNLIFSQGGTTLSTGDFSSLGYTSNADADVKLTGYADVSATGFSSNATPIDLYSCLGDCSLYTDNQFAANTLSSADLPMANYSIADQLENGAPISGLGTAPLGVTLGNASQAGVGGFAVGSSTSNNVLGATWTFSGISGTIDISYTMDWYLETFVSAFARFPTSAQANYEVTWEITDVAGNLLWEAEMSESSSSTAPWHNNIPRLGAGMTLDTASNQAVTLTTAALDVDTTYTLSGVIQTTADVTSVPEPATLALLGISLLGFGAVRKRRTV